MDTLLSLFSLDGVLDALHYAWSFFLILSVIVFVHEFGHYIVAKLCGVRILAFSIGFGRELCGWTDASGTRWKISLVPMGGYVQMFGDAGAASTPDNTQNATLSDEERAVTFHHKPLWKKALIVAAGPAFNFILTIGILTAMLMSYGLPSAAPVVSEVLEDSAAQEAGILTGDIVLTVDGNTIKTFGDIPRLVMTNTGTPVTLTLQRGEKILTKTLTPRMRETTDSLGNTVMLPLIGLKSEAHKITELNLLQAIGEAVKRTYDICAMSVDALGQMLVGERDASELKGPIGIAKLSGQATGMSFETVLWFIALLSANLGFVNLLPVPLLDGGHLMYYAIEAATGRPLAEKFQEYGFRLGFALIACLMAFTILNDIRTIF